MPERSAITQVVQIGVETTMGTSVAANKAPLSFMFTATPNIETDEFTPMGYKYPTLITPNKDWVEADIAGKAAYEDIVYLLSCILGTATITTTGTTGKQWAFAPSSTTEDAIKSLTVEVGSSLRAGKWTYGIISDFGISFSRDGIDLSGKMLGQNYTDGITLTASPTALALVPILPGQVSVYLDSTSGGLGTTKLLRAFKADWSLAGRFGPIWTLNAALASFAAHVEGDPTNDIALLVEADAAGMALLTNLRAGTTQFIRIEAVGAVIGAGPATYKFTLDAAVKVGAANELGDEDGVYAIEWPLKIVHDGTWGKAFTVTVINSLAAL